MVLQISASKIKLGYCPKKLLKGKSYLFAKRHRQWNLFTLILTDNTKDA